MVKQIDIKTASYRILYDTPAHCTYGLWINGGKMGELTCRQEEREAFCARMELAGFRNQDAGSDTSPSESPGSQPIETL